MSGIISSGAWLEAKSIARPSLRLVDSDQISQIRAIVRTPDESRKAAVMSCLGAGSSGNSELLRKASAAPHKNGGQLYAVIVDSPHARLGKAQFRALIVDLFLASSLGAKVVRLESSDVLGALLRFARQCHVGRIFVMRERPAPLSRLFGPALYSCLLARGKCISIDVVGFESGN
jgi:K+-sensing histidine kinase KdpD